MFLFPDSWAQARPRADLLIRDCSGMASGCRKMATLSCSNGQDRLEETTKPLTRKDLLALRIDMTVEASVDHKISHLCLPIWGGRSPAP